MVPVVRLGPVLRPPLPANGLNVVPRSDEQGRRSGSLIGMSGSKLFQRTGAPVGCPGKLDELLSGIGGVANAAGGSITISYTALVITATRIELDEAVPRV